MKYFNMPEVCEKKRVVREFWIKTFEKLPFNFLWPKNHELNNVHLKMCISSAESLFNHLELANTGKVCVIIKSSKRCVDFMDCMFF